MSTTRRGSSPGAVGVANKGHPPTFPYMEEQADSSDDTGEQVGVWLQEGWAEIQGGREGGREGEECGFRREGAVSWKEKEKEGGRKGGRENVVHKMNGFMIGRDMIKGRSIPEK